MKFLIDAQLPPRLKKWLIDHGAEDAVHVEELEGGLRMDDHEIWEVAKRHAWTIVTKDMDFFDMSAVSGSPPGVLLVRYGNCSNAMMMELLSSAWPEIEARLMRAEVRLILVERKTLEIYRD